MSDLSRFLQHAGRQCAAAVLAFALYLLWGALGVLAVAQVYIATRNEVEIPGFVLRRLEGRLAEAGIRMEFDRATFDPTGRILVVAPRVFVPPFADPVVTAQAAYIGLRPWPALVGEYDLRELRILDGTVFVPAMLSPSGRSEPVVRDLDALVVPGVRQTVFRHLNARVGGLIVSVHGGVALRGGPRRSPAEIAALVRARFTEFCKRAVDFSRRLEIFEQPSLDLELKPSATQGAVASVELTARSLKLDAPYPVEFNRLRVMTELPLLGEAPAVSQIDLFTDQLRFAAGIEVQRLSASLRGRVVPAELRVEPMEIDLSADHVTSADGAADTVSAIVRPVAPSRWRADVSGRILGSELGLRGQIDLAERTAKVDFSGRVSPRVLDTVSRRVQVNVRQFFDFETLACKRAAAVFGPGWKFERLDAWVALRRINAYGVIMDEGEAVVALDPHRFHSPEAFGRIGENFARGSYEHDFATHEFRFLLKGQLRPLAIGEWFHAWWPNFFGRFDFPLVPPAASVDVHGFWRDGRSTSVFVFADAKSPVVLGQKLDRVRTRLFIRPGFYDGLELFGLDPDGGTAEGTFNVVANVESGEWRTIDVDAFTTVSLDIASRMAGALAKPLLDPFKLEQAPAVKALVHLDGPDMGANRRQRVDLSAQSAGGFRFHGLPLEDVAFTAKLRDDELTIDATEARFAGGALRVHAKVWGAEEQRRLGFDATLSDASLGVAVAALQTVAAQRKGQKPPPVDKFIQEKANVRVDIAASADGLYGNTLSFHGGGNASLRGAEIGEVPLFGPLSELLKFTALRFTDARTSFKINGARLEFPDVALRGANSAIDAHGEYALDRRQLDFRAKVFPFQESGSVIKSVVGAVLTPISNVLEVKLTGSLDKPDWAFVIGPTNLLRSLTPDESAGEAEKDGAPAPAPNATSPAASPAIHPEKPPVPVLPKAK